MEICDETLARCIATIGIAVPVSHHMDTLSLITARVYNNWIGADANGNFVYRCTNMWCFFATDAFTRDAWNARFWCILYEYGLGQFHTISITWIDFSVRDVYNLQLQLQLLPILKWNFTSSDLALVNIMLLAGLGIDLKAFVSKLGAVTRLSIIPTVGEVITITLIAKWALGMTWLWGLLLG